MPPLPVMLFHPETPLLVVRNSFNSDLLVSAVSQLLFNVVVRLLVLQTLQDRLIIDGQFLEFVSSDPEIHARLHRGVLATGRLHACTGAGWDQGAQVSGADVLLAGLRRGDCLHL